ncbi:hypothetical protein BH24ACT14_BH24ACT14_14110 [soil metagenome]|jgi:predicted short-subunit dehydrogenase-like oxidoreductase (DUF2520 family)
MRRVAVIGPGRVGTALGMALDRAGYRIVAVAGRSRQGSDDFVRRLPSARSMAAADAARGAELVLVCVGDDALVEVVRRVAAADAVAEGSRWVHTSGGYGTDVLEPVRLAGAAVAACHPAQTFPDPDTGLAALPGTSWAVTADEGDLGWARVLVTDLRGSPVTVDAGSRTLYHAGLTVGSNATATVVTLARDLLLGAGVTDPSQFLGPLVTTSASNAASRGAAALTGPVRRGDAGTVARQLDELRTVLPEAVEAYLALSRLALRHARRAGLGDEAAAAVAAVLDN